MITYYSTSDFRKSLSELLNYKRKAYSSIADDICNAFVNKSIEEIRQNRDMILIDTPMIIVKLRIMDKQNKRSRKDGHRLIYMTFADTEKVIFLFVYPKNGPLQRLIISSSELLNLLDIYNSEKESNSLIETSITDGMKSIIALGK